MLIRDCYPRTLEHNLKEMRAAEDETMKGQKGSRLSKWIASADARREKMGAAEPESLQNLGQHRTVDT